MRLLSVELLAQWLALPVEEINALRGWSTISVHIRVVDWAVLPCCALFFWLLNALAPSWLLGSLVRLLWPMHVDHSQLKLLSLFYNVVTNLHLMHCMLKQVTLWNPKQVFTTSVTLIILDSTKSNWTSPPNVNIIWISSSFTCNHCNINIINGEEFWRKEGRNQEGWLAAASMYWVLLFFFFMLKQSYVAGTLRMLPALEVKELVGRRGICAVIYSHSTAALRS